MSRSLPEDLFRWIVEAMPEPPSRRRSAGRST